MLRVLYLSCTCVITGVVPGGAGGGGARAEGELRPRAGRAARRHPGDGPLAQRQPREGDPRPAGGAHRPAGEAAEQVPGASTPDRRLRYTLDAQHRSSI